MRTKNIYLLRHSITDFNNQKKIFGKSDIPLNRNGIELAHNIKHKFKDKNIQGVLTSDLKRAYQTGEIISNMLEVPLSTNKLLRERDQGIYEGLSLEDVNKLMPNFSFDTRVEERETVREFMDRTKFVFNSIAEEIEWENFIIVTHNGVLKMFMSIFLKKNTRKWELCEARKVQYNELQKEWLLYE